MIGSIIAAGFGLIEMASDAKEKCKQMVESGFGGLVDGMARGCSAYVLLLTYYLKDDYF
jgi:hypothetical protein